MKNTQVALHGEAMIIFGANIPATAKPIKASNAGYHIIADSETTGNHHVVDCPAGVEFFQDGDKTYMKNSQPTQVRCVIAERHNPITLEPGAYEFGIQQEYDHLAQHLRNVAD